MALCCAARLRERATLRVRSRQVAHGPGLTSAPIDGDADLRAVDRVVTCPIALIGARLASRGRAQIIRSVAAPERRVHGTLAPRPTARPLAAANHRTHSDSAVGAHARVRLQPFGERVAFSHGHARLADSAPNDITDWRDRTTASHRSEAAPNGMSFSWWCWACRRSFPAASRTQSWTRTRSSRASTTRARAIPRQPSPSIARVTSVRASVLDSSGRR